MFPPPLKMQASFLLIRTFLCKMLPAAPQLNDGSVLSLLRDAARREAYSQASSLHASGSGSGLGSGSGSGSSALAQAAALLDRLDRRDLYRFVGSAPLERALSSAELAEVVSDLVALARQTERSSVGDAASLEPEDLRVDVRYLSHGTGAANPLEQVRFFDNKPAGSLSSSASAHSSSSGASPRALPEARRHPAASTQAALPRAFEERSLRVFATSRRALPAARAAFLKLCSQRGLVHDDG